MNMALFSEMVEKIARRRIILRKPVALLHATVGAMPTFNANLINDLANSSNPNGLYFVQDDLNGRLVLEDLGLELDEFAGRNVHKVQLPAGTVVGFAREVFRLSCDKVTTPSLCDLWFELGREEHDYRRLLQLELAKYMDVLLITNFGYCSGWAELVRVR